MKILLSITGATGAIYGIRLLEALKNTEHHVSLILSRWAETTISTETAYTAEEVKALADAVYDEEDLAAAVSSGTFVTDGMVVLPCSMKTLAGVASGYADNLINRAVDVCLKEGRKVVLVPREAPLSKLHLRNMLEASESGCVILPPVLSFYQGEITIEGQINHIIGKILMQFGLKYDKFNPWKGM